MLNGKVHYHGKRQTCDKDINFFRQPICIFIFATISTAFNAFSRVYVMVDIGNVYFSLAYTADIISHSITRIA